MGGDCRRGVESVYRHKGGLMFETAADVSSILSIDIGLLIGLLVLAQMLDPAQSHDRVLFGTIAALLLVTYALWRWHDTLPSASSVQGWWQYLFFAFEALAIAYTLTSIVILFRSIDRSGQADAAERQMEQAGDYPAVDVFICTYDEPLEVLERSILTALALDYPNVTVWVLDDTRRGWLRDYCAGTGARYVTRPNNEKAKAGNLNNALRVTADQTNAPVILVLDADFAPRPDFLRRTVGLLLSSPQAAVVQTPQFYCNPDPIQHNLLAVQSWVDDQRFFFDVFQPAKDAWGCAFCVGTSFVVRRDRLTELGGFPDQAISEDINLTYALLAKGFETWWLNERLSTGLSAEGIPEYITQRSRWCLGTIQVALLRDGPMRGSGFTLTQRWHYLHGILNWLSKPYLVLLLVAPSIYWFAGIPAFEADYLSFLRYGLPALLGQTIYMAWVSRSRTLPLFMEATHAISAFAVSATLVSAAIKPFGRPFKVTNKGGDRSQPKTHWKFAALFGLISLSSAASIVWAFVSPYAASEISPLDYFNLLWAGVAMLIAFIAFLVCFELGRGETLFDVDEAVHLASGGEMIPGRLTALSTSSARMSCDGRPTCLVDGIALVHHDLLGWIDAEISDCNETLIGLRLRPTAAQRQRLAIWLFSLSDDNVANTASMTGTVAGTIRKGLRGG
jgi:cellulose synthase (UDP-forming)